MKSVAAILVLVSLALPASARAGLFGGFDASGAVQRGTDQLCQPVREPMGVPSCKKKKSTELARLRLQPGTLQRGGSSDVVVEREGTRLVLRDGQSQDELFRWDSGQPIASVGNVYLDATKTVVAIEYATRFGGRTVDDLVAIALRASLKARVEPTSATASTSPSDTAGATPPRPSAAQPDADSEATVAALEAGRKLAKRRKHTAAVAEYQKILANRADHAEALYLWARSAQSLKDTKTALAKLALLRASQHAEAPRWRVEARFDKVFESLRADATFRKAVGIDPDPQHPLTAFERLVGQGGKWEQEQLACEQPLVQLTLARDRKARFDLVIKSNCQGMRETTRLDGTWKAKGQSDLELHFPNLEGPEENMMCALERCADGSGEDCLRCQPESDIEFLFRAIRR